MALGELYIASFANVSVTAQQDLFAVIAPSDAVTVVRRIRIAQRSDSGNAQAEHLSIEVATYTGANGSGGSTPTPRALQSGANAAGTVVHANDTTQAATVTVVEPDAFNVQNGWFWVPAASPLILSPSAKAVVRLTKTPADALTMSGSLLFEEIG